MLAMLVDDNILSGVTQVGVGGIFAIFILREVFTFINKRGNGNGNGNGSKTDSGGQSVAFWQLEIRNAVNESVTQQIVPHLQAQTRVLEEIRDTMGEMEKGINELVTRDRDRVNQHNAHRAAGAH
jgi:hypothetical protein